MNSTLFEPTLMISLASAVLGGVAWLLRLEGKVTTNETVNAVLHKTVVEDIKEIKADLKKVLYQVKITNGDPQS